MKGKFNMRFNPETKTYKLFSALHKGETVTASQAEKRFGVKNISAEVSENAYRSNQLLKWSTPEAADYLRSFTAKTKPAPKP